LTELPKRELLRPDEVARYYSVTVRTVRNWIYDGKITAVKIARNVIRVHRSSLVKMGRPVEDE